MKNNPRKSDDKNIISDLTAREAMWDFYRKNKNDISLDIRNYREIIIKQLMAGASMEKLFFNFLNNPSTNHKNLEKNNTPIEENTIKQTRPPWPFK